MTVKLGYVLIFLVIFVQCTKVISIKILNETTSTRISDASPADLKRIPYMVAVAKNVTKGTRSTNRFDTYCGGAVLSRLYVLSAAHCFVQNNTIDSKLVQESRAIINCKQSTTTNGCGTWRAIKRVIVHPNYNNPFHNLAVLALDKPFPRRTRRIKVQARPSRSLEKCITAGYGPGEEKSVLTKADVTVEKQECKNHPELKGSREFLCTPHYGDVLFTKVDSGGPLVCRIKPKRGRIRGFGRAQTYLVGIILAGRKNSTYYARLFNDYRWIAKTAKLKGISLTSSFWVLFLLATLLLSI